MTAGFPLFSTILATSWTSSYELSLPVSCQKCCEKQLLPLTLNWKSVRSCVRSQSQCIPTKLEGKTFLITNFAPSCAHTHTLACTHAHSCIRTKNKRERYWLSGWGESKGFVKPEARLTRIIYTLHLVLMLRNRKLCRKLQWWTVSVNVFFLGRLDWRDMLGLICL